MKILDLRIGNATFLEPYWRNVGGQTPSTTHHSYMPYAPHGGIESLHNEIKELHNLIGNAKTSNRTVVVGSGATQMLFATAQVLAEMYGGLGQVYTKPPYYFRFPYIFKSAGFDFITNPDPASVEIVCAPGNPTCEFGTEEPSPSITKIYDCCYNWPTYVGDDVANMDQDIMLFSLSKATGHAGTRIGWGLFKDPVLAEIVAMRTEFMSGGSSIDAQWRATQILNRTNYEINLKDNKFFKNTKNIFAYGREVLEARWERLFDLNLKELKPLNRRGMFLYAEYPAKDFYHSSENFEKQTGIMVVRGSDLGGPLETIRINMACSDSDFEELMLRLNKLEKATP